MDNDSTTSSGPPEPAAEPPLAPPPSLPVTRKKPRLWLHITIATVAVLFLLGGLAVVGLLVYAGSLVKNYTSTRPQPLPRVETSTLRMIELRARLEDFAKAVGAKTSSSPLRLEADDLNALISGIPDLKNRLFLRIHQNRLQSEFSFPLDKTGKAQLKGRHVNGLATLDLALKDGFLELRITDLQANGKTAPSWLLAKLKGKNLLENLERNVAFLEFLQDLDSVEIKEGAVVLTPLGVK